ncbi:hypothetical protein HK101_003048, partial [Irineochytrium annulatum]
MLRRKEEELLLEREVDDEEATTFEKKIKVKEVCGSWPFRVRGQGLTLFYSYQMQQRELEKDRDERVKVTANPQAARMNAVMLLSRRGQKRDLPETPVEEPPRIHLDLALRADDSDMSLAEATHGGDGDRSVRSHGDFGTETGSPSVRPAALLDAREGNVATPAAPGYAPKPSRQTTSPKYAAVNENMRAMSMPRTTFRSSASLESPTNAHRAKTMPRISTLDDPAIVFPSRGTSLAAAATDLPPADVNAAITQYHQMQEQGGGTEGEANLNLKEMILAGGQTPAVAPTTAIAAWAASVAAASPTWSPPTPLPYSQDGMGNLSLKSPSIAINPRSSSHNIGPLITPPRREPVPSTIGTMKKTDHPTEPPNNTRTELQLPSPEIVAAHANTGPGKFMRNFNSVFSFATRPRGRRRSRVETDAVLGGGLPPLDIRPSEVNKRRSKSASTLERFPSRNTRRNSLESNRSSVWGVIEERRQNEPYSTGTVHRRVASESVARPPATPPAAASPATGTASLRPLMHPDLTLLKTGAVIVPARSTSMNAAPALNLSPRLVTDIDGEQPRRQFLMHGHAWQVITTTSVKDRHLFLFNDVLVIAKEVRDAAHPDRNSYDIKSVMDIQRARLALSELRESSTSGILRNLNLQSSSSPPTDSAIALSPLAIAITRFANHPVKAVCYLIAKHVLPCTPQAIAHFLHTTPGLSRRQIGKFLGLPEHNDILSAYLASFAFRGMRIDVSLRVFLGSLRLPGQVSIIDLILDAFARWWAESNPDVFGGEGTGGSF